MSIPVIFKHCSKSDDQSKKDQFFAYSFVRLVTSETGAVVPCAIEQTKGRKDNAPPPPRLVDDFVIASPAATAGSPTRSTGSVRTVMLSPPGAIVILLDETTLPDRLRLACSCKRGHLSALLFCSLGRHPLAHFI